MRLGEGPQRLTASTVPVATSTSDETARICDVRVSEDVQTLRHTQPSARTRSRWTIFTKWPAPRYWRGPVWINTNWLLWSGLRQHGRDRKASEIARASLALVARSGQYEYFDPFGGAGYGSDAFSWTAALTLDLLRRLDAADIRGLARSDGRARAG